MTRSEQKEFVELSVIHGNRFDQGLSVIAAFAGGYVPPGGTLNVQGPKHGTPFQNTFLGKKTTGLLRVQGRDTPLISGVPGAARSIPKAPVRNGSDLAGSVRNVNPTRGTQNCVNCSIATDATLARHPASALPGNPKSIRFLEKEFGGTFNPVSGQIEIGSTLSRSGNGARGIVFGQSRTPGNSGHVFNAVNQNGTIRFLDGQTGGLGVNNFDNFQNFRFLLTNPGTP